MWVLWTSLIISLFHCALSQDCVNCLTVPCQTPQPQASESIWTICLPCLQKVYPQQCSSTAYSCALYLTSLDSTSCCSSVPAKLLQGLQSELPPSCTPLLSSSTLSNGIASAALPSASLNGQPLQFIMPQMNFSCSGCFQTLNITLKEQVSSNSTFLFQLWRRYIPTGDQTSVVTNELYQLNTSVPLTVIADPLSSSNVYSLPLNVCFREGDIVGIQLPSTSLLKIATDNSSVIYRREIPAQCSDVVSGIFQPSQNSTGSPLITLVISPTPLSPSSTIYFTSLPLVVATSQSSVSTFSSLMPSMQTINVPAATVFSRPLSPLIAPVSTAAGVVLVLVLILLVSTVAVLCLRKNREMMAKNVKTSDHFSTRISPEITPSTKVPYVTTSAAQLQSKPSEPQVVRTQRLSGLPSLLEESSECSHSVSAVPPPPNPYETISNTDKKSEGIYDHPRELELRPLPSHTYHTMEVLSEHVSETGHSVDHSKDETDLSQATSTSISSNEDSLKIESSNQQVASTQLYHVLENTKRDPITGNPYHVLEEQLRAQNDQTPKYGVYVPNPRQRKRILIDGEEKWYEKSRAKMEKDKKFFHDKEQFWHPASDDVILYEQLSKYRFREILREDISVGDELGSGAFGTVYKAVWKFSGGKMGVAVKVMKQSIAQGAKVRFLQEAAVMGQFFHPNVVKLHGVVTVGEPPMIVLELMPRGDLSSFLKNYHTPGERPPPTPTFLLLCSRDIVCGMKYLSYKGFVHRDLAARNILLTEDLKCKIGDFGLSRDLDENPYYISHKGTIPLKWSAPEAFMHGKFSTSSDVYSYGMLLFEIWSCGCKPMANVPMGEAKRLLAEGYCQPPPPGCPRGIYQVMVQCWNPQHSYRPSFGEIHEYLSASDETILAWSSSDKEVSQQATVLGAPLSEGVELYKDLQQTYRPLEMT